MTFWEHWWTEGYYHQLKIRLATKTNLHHLRFSAFYSHLHRLITETWVACVASRSVRMQLQLPLHRRAHPGLREASAFSDTWALTWSACGCWCRLAAAVMLLPAHPSIHPPHPSIHSLHSIQALRDTQPQSEWEIWNGRKTPKSFQSWMLLLLLLLEPLGGDVVLMWFRSAKRETSRISVPDGLSKSAIRSECDLSRGFFSLTRLMQYRVA